MNLSIACIVPTLNGLNDLIRLVDSIARQKLNLDLVIVDSGSSDGTLNYLIDNKIEHIIISSSNFNHGGTRQMMIDLYPNYDVYVFLTQDAYLEDDLAIRNLVQPFFDSSIGAVCGRQLPHLNANLFAEHARTFNYPGKSSVKRLSSVDEYGLKTVFLSNSFAAYRNQALLDVGGFPLDVIFAEDMYIAAKMIKAGWGIAYSADAKCRHSHNYSINEEFRRYFDMGVFHAREPWIKAEFGGVSGEGLRYLKSEISFIGIHKYYLWPLSLIRNVIKLIAFKLGSNEKYLPLLIKRQIGSFRGYWSRSC
jgi:rhamnosyltransferase